MLSRVKDGKVYCWACESYDCSCVNGPEPEPKVPCTVFIYLMKEGKMPKKFRDLKDLGINVLSRFDQPDLSGEFRDEFVEDDGVKIIMIDPHNLLEIYFHEASGAYIPEQADYLSEAAMKKDGVQWQPGDCVFLLLRRAPDEWYLKGGVYQPAK